MKLPDLPYQMLDVLSDAVALLDPGGLVVYANSAFQPLEALLCDSVSRRVCHELLSLALQTPSKREGAVRKQIPAPAGSGMLDVSVYTIYKSKGRQPFYLVLLKPCSKAGEAGLSAEEELSALYGGRQAMLSEELAPEFGELKGEDPGLKMALLTAQKAARTDFPVLILGESGTGKEILARTIHKASRRMEKSYVDINCAAIPENLIESELFGYEKGAFTGARPDGRRGLFEEAHEGSIFLDEIGDASLQIQSKLLRVLQEGRFKRVGGNRNIEVNVRHISATNKDLTVLIADERFREDLFYRLNTITIELPPLRKRPNDIPLLIEQFLMHYTRRENKAIMFSSESLELMESYAWPGNVRELKGVVDYAVTMAAGSLITPDCLPSFLLPRKGAPQERARSAPAPAPGPAGRTVMDSSLAHVVESVEKEMIQRALEGSANRSEAIKKLGISRRTFYIKIKQYGLD